MLISSQLRIYKMEFSDKIWQKHRKQDCIHSRPGNPLSQSSIITYKYIHIIINKFTAQSVISRKSPPRQRFPSSTSSMPAAFLQSIEYKNQSYISQAPWKSFPILYRPHPPPAIGGHDGDPPPPPWLRPRTFRYRGAPPPPPVPPGGRQLLPLWLPP